MRIQSVQITVASILSTSNSSTYPELKNRTEISRKMRIPSVQIIVEPPLCDAQETAEERRKIVEEYVME